MMCIFSLKTYCDKCSWMCCACKGIQCSSTVLHVASGERNIHLWETGLAIALPAFTPCAMVCQGITSCTACMCVQSCVRWYTTSPTILLLGQETNLSIQLSLASPTKYTHIMLCHSCKVAVTQADMLVAFTFQSVWACPTSWPGRQGPQPPHWHPILRDILVSVTMFSQS